MASKRTLKALEELVKTEYMAVAALDAALEQVEDNKLRKQYRKFRDEHMKQAERLNERLEELGGEPIPYEVGTGKGQASLWGRLTGMREDTSVEGMRIGAERGIKRYIDHIDDIEDPKTLNIIRKNLEAKQDEMRWYDEQAARERAETVETKLEVSKEKARELEALDGKKKGGLPLPLLIVAGAIGAAAYFLLRRGEEAEYEDYGEEAFRYETEETGTEGGYSSTGSFTGGTEGTTGGS
jgi:bacterioferritin (cytochrome b1)